jgi:WD40 repeat protein
MSIRPHALLFAASVCLAQLAFTGCRAAVEKPEQPAADEPPWTDPLGDPPPPGVVARLGTGRLSHPHADFLVFSPDDKMLASLEFWRGDLRVWDVHTGKELWRFKGSGDSWGRYFTPAAFSPDGKLLALCCKKDHTIRVFDASTGRERYKLDGITSYMANQLAFSPDGKRLAAGCGYTCSNQVVLQWDLDAGKALGESGDVRVVAALAYSADGKSLAALGIDKDGHNVFCRWDAATGKELVRKPSSVIHNGQGVLTSYGALSPDGALIAAPTEDGEAVPLLDPETGKELRRCEGQTDSFVAFSSDGRFLIGAAEGGAVRIWDAATGKVWHEFKAPPAYRRSVALSHNGKLAAVAGGSEDFAVHVWDTAEGKELHTFSGHRRGWLKVAFSTDGKSVYTANRDSKRIPLEERADWSLRRWDPRTGKELGVTRADLKGSVSWTAFSPDGRLLAVVMRDGALLLLDADSGKELARGSVPTRAEKADKDPEAAVSQPAFSADGETLFAASGPEIHRWNAATGEELPVIKTTAEGKETRCLPAPDGRSLLMTDRRSSNNGDLCWLTLWDMVSGRSLRPMGEVRINIYAFSLPECAFSPDGKTVAFADGATVHLREVFNGRDRGSVEGKQDESVRGLAFSPDGRLLAVGGEDGVRLIHLASGREVGRVDGCGDVDSLAFSPDGRLLAVGGFSNVALVCDVAELTKDKWPAPAALTAKELDALWDDLSGGDGEKAYRAVGRLAESAAESVPFLKARVPAVAEADAPRIARLIADLDNDDFEVREKASAALDRLGMAAEGALTRARDKSPSAEVRARAARLLERLHSDGASPSPVLVALRALEALESSGTSEARDVLKDVANGAPEAELTQAARAALERLARRPGAPAP